MSKMKEPFDIFIAWTHEMQTPEKDDWLDKPDFLIGDYTCEQWQEVIDNCILCEFSNRSDFSDSVVQLLDSIESDEKLFSGFVYNSNSNNGVFKFCRIHSSQAQFNLGHKPDWLNDNDNIITDKCAIIVPAYQVTWDNPTNTFKHWQLVQLTQLTQLKGDYYV